MNLPIVLKILKVFVNLIYRKKLLNFLSFAISFKFHCNLTLICKLFFKFAQVFVDLLNIFNPQIQLFVDILLNCCNYLILLFNFLFNLHFNLFKVLSFFLKKFFINSGLSFLIIKGSESMNKVS